MAITLPDFAGVAEREQLFVATGGAFLWNGELVFFVKFYFCGDDAIVFLADCAVENFVDG